MKKIAIIIPVYNEQENITRVVHVLDDVTHKISSLSFQYIFVNDGSSDHTKETLEQLHAQKKYVHFINFSRNFGKEAALLAGLKHCEYDAAILMDGDLQHPPSLIPELITAWEEGYDQVIAKRDRQGEHFIKSLFAKSYYYLINRITSVEMKDGEGDFRLLSKRASEALLSLNEHQRFSKGLYEWIGFPKKTICYRNVIREDGETKWSFKQLINYGVDGILSFNTKPLRICFYLGLATFLLSLFYIGYTFFQIVRGGIDVPGYFTTISAVLLLGSIQLFSLGIIGEYIGRIYNETKKRPHYIVDNASLEGEQHD